MIDLEKTIKGLEIRIHMVPGKYDCNECPYEIDGNRCEINLANDALFMLKKQEAVKPKSKVRHGANAQIQHFCGNCNAMLHGKPKFCSECGRMVLW